MRSVEDEMWGSRLQFNLKNFSFIPTIGVFRCIRPGSDGSNDLNYCRRSLNSIKQRYKFMEEHNLLKMHASSFFSYVVQRICIITSAWDKMEDRYRQLDEGLDLFKELYGVNLKRQPFSYLSFQSLNWCNFYDALFAGKDCPNVMWFGLPSVHDSLNPQMRALRRLLECLRDCGCHVNCVTTTICRDPVGLEGVNTVLQQMHEYKRSILHKVNALDSSSLYRFTDNAIDYLMINTQSLQVENVTQFDERFLEQSFVHVVSKKKPEVALVTGSDPCSLKLFSMLKAFGIPLIYVVTGQEEGFLPNAPQPKPLLSTQVELKGTYTLPSTTAEVLKMFDKVVTFSDTLAQKWQQISDIPVINLGYITRPTFVKQLSDKCSYVTISSNAIDHGFGLAIKIALVLSKLMPEQKLLLIQEQNKNIHDTFKQMHDIFEQMHYSDGTPALQDISNLKNIYYITRPFNMDLVYDQSQILLDFNLDPNGWADSAVDALNNGVQVITTNVGEAAKILKQGVTCLPVPASIQNDLYCLPTDEEVAPFIEAIKQLLAQKAEDRRKQALAAFNLNQTRKNWYDLLVNYSASFKHKQKLKEQEAKDQKEE